MLDNWRAETGLERSDTESATLTVVPSAVIEGLDFLVLTVSDSAIVDGGVLVNTAAVWRGERALLRSPDDLVALIGDSLLTSADPVGVCAEMVVYAAGRLFLSRLPVILPDTSSLQAVAAATGLVLGDPGGAYHAPRVTPGGEVELWAAETNRIVRYHCSPGKESMGLQPIDSVVGAGFVTG